MLYQKLIALYPRAFREQLGESMTQTFNDLYTEHKKSNEWGIPGFVLQTFIETFWGIIQEHRFEPERSFMSTLSANPKSAALIGFLLTLPFLVINFIVALRIEPFYSLLGSVPAIRATPLTPLLLLLLFPLGAFIAIRPMFRKTLDGRRRILVGNSILAITMLGFFLVVFAALGEELYRCHILSIPNCD